MFPYTGVKYKKKKHTFKALWEAVSVNLLSWDIWLKTV